MLIHVADASRSVSTGIQLEPTHFQSLNSQRIEVTYGTYTVPPRSEDDGMMHFRGRFSPPCTDCLVTSMLADIRYPNDTVADASTGMWMHHVVFVNLNRSDSTCPEILPSQQRFFASGNERTEVDLTAGGANKLGYAFNATDMLAMQGELMNLLDEAQKVVVSVTWEFIDRSSAIAAGFREVVPYWLDVGGCGNSDKPALPDQAFEYGSPRLHVRAYGEIAFVGGHLHDGGTHIDMLRDDKVICTMRAAYGKADASVDGMEHIAHIPVCTDVGAVDRNDQWTIKAYYDTIEHPPMALDDGSLEPVMGIAIAYVVGGERNSGKGKGSSYNEVLWIVLPLISLVLVATGLGLRRNPEVAQSWYDWIRYRGWQRVKLDDEQQAAREEEGTLLAGQRHNNDDEV
ncbi:hypothetical protein BAUCODRAFT_521522 [Baudoinia panamericana UAMH 10762]|uniref:Uncharacterized protein n=1 Tax=Baudoinia panamericana (strain UAMH 10762) TaxID=717646 RepID=M2MTZ4_BAUPA|nr:uncharacterized protein BAUCODRAFT_521522 [Baudoinia panamericana UAMH 10762]EMC95003.1 hypothetical protein BAUCODRAFT_521522 [Baudoinia panamericana UAMH 10762]